MENDNNKTNDVMQVKPDRNQDVQATYLRAVAS